MLPVRPVTLADSVVSLEPLSPDHAEALWRAASGSRATYGLTRVPDSLDDARAYVDAALGELARGVSVPFVTRDLRSRGRSGGGSSDSGIVGSTRFMTIERWVWPPPNGDRERPEGHADVIEIGATWLAADAQRTAVNTHAKLLMLTHAFEAWEVRRVMLKTDARNARSRAAIERIGGTLDGVLRAHMPAFDGAVRNTAFYSILAAEWPAVKGSLRTRIEAAG
jgi:RimJ/RimL family protein N-acetyltransferase